jgi:hypothetical protein
VAYWSSFIVSLSSSILWIPSKLWAKIRTILAQYLFYIEKGNFLTKLTSALGGAQTVGVKADHPIYGLLAIWQNAFIWLQ